MLPEVEDALMPLFERRRKELIALGYPERAVDDAIDWVFGRVRGVFPWYDRREPIEMQRKTQVRLGLRFLDEMNRWIEGFRRVYAPELPLPAPPPFVPTEEEIKEIEKKLGIDLSPSPEGLEKEKLELAKEKFKEIVGK